MQPVKEKAAGAATPGVLVPGMQFPYPYPFPPHFPQQAPKEKKGKKERKRGRKEKRERSSDESSKEVSSKRSSCSRSSSSSGSTGSKRKKKRRKKRKKKESESSASSDEEGRRRAAAAAAAVGVRELRPASRSKAVKEEPKEEPEEKVAAVPAKQEPKSEPLEKPEKAKAALAKKGAVAAKSKAKPAAGASRPRQQGLASVKEELGREEAFRPPERIEALDMPRELMGHIVGKAGAIIKAICQESGAQVDAFDATQDPVRVLVSGSWEAVEEARTMLLEVAESVATATGHVGPAVKAATTAPSVLAREAPLEIVPAKPQGPMVQEHLELPYHATGKIIGTRGQQISEVRAKSGAQVDVDKTSNGLCRVRMLGTQEQVLLAKSMISKITDPGGEGEFMEISRSAVGRIIGAGGVRIQELQERSGVKIDIDRATEPCLVRFAGFPENVAYAKQLVVEVLEGRDKTTLGEAVVNIDVPPSCTGRLIGPGGRQINEIQETSGAKVDIDKSTDPCVVRMTGSHENVAKAEVMVRAVLQAIGRGRPLLGRATTDEETINFDVPTAVAAHLLGDGAWLRAMEMRTGAKAFLRQQADGSYMLELSGLPEQVVEAEQLAEEAVRSISAAATVPAIAPGARKLVRPPAPPQLEMGVVSKAAQQPWLPLQACPQPWPPALPVGQRAAEQAAAVPKAAQEEGSQTLQKAEGAPARPAVEPAAQPPVQPPVEGALPAPPPPAQLTAEAGAEAKPQLHLQAPTEQLPQPPPPPGPPPASNPTFVAWPAPMAPQPIFAAWPGTVPIPLVAAPWMGCAVPAFAPQ